jgi:hypothetical protein
MSELDVSECSGVEKETCATECEMNSEKKGVSKRDIIRFTGEKPVAINLEHVTSMYVDGKRITFEFYTKAQYIDMLDEEAAVRVFEVLVKAWCGNVL